MSRCCPLNFVQFATNLLLIHPIHQFTPLLDVPQLSLPMFKLSKNRVPCITMILHINQTRKNHNPKFRSENEITPIFLRYSPLNLEKFGVLNDAHALQKVPQKIPRLPTTDLIPRLTHLQMLPATYSYTHHKKHFEFLLQLMSQSHPSRLLLPEC